jgi:hypothetical protein
MKQRFAGWCRKTGLAWAFATLLLLLALGCSGSATQGTATAVISSSDDASAPRGKAVADPFLREARDEAEAVLLGLLLGKFDEDENLSLVAEKVKGYTSWSIKSQQIAGKGRAEFKGTLSGPAGQAGFRMMLVKQASGPWTIGTFYGPDSS